MKIGQKGIATTAIVAIVVTVVVVAGVSAAVLLAPRSGSLDIPKGIVEGYL